MPITIVHGGQTGVDRGAHLGALDASLAIAGWAPKHERDELGPIPPEIMKHLYTCAQGDTYSGAFRARTGANVELAQAILLVVQDSEKPLSGGTQLTYRLGREHQLERPVLVLDTNSALIELKDWLVNIVFDLYDDDRIKLMVAGPRASKWAAGEQVTRSLVAAIGSW